MESRARNQTEEKNRKTDRVESHSGIPISLVGWEESVSQPHGPQQLHQHGAWAEGPKYLLRN